MRRRAAIIQFVGSMGIMGITAAQGVILVPFYLYYLGVERYGAWLAVGNFVTLLALADLGITTFASQRSARYYAEHNYHKLGRFLVALITFGLLATIVIIIAAQWLSLVLPNWFNVAPEMVPQLRDAFRIAALEVVLMLFTTIFGSVLYGLQKPSAHLGAQIVGTALGIPVAIVLLRADFGVKAIPCALLMRSFCMLPVNALALMRALRDKIRLDHLRLDRETLQDFMSSSLWLGPAKFAEAVLGQIDSVAVMKLLGPVEVTTLSLTRKASQLVVLIAGRFSASTLSGLSHLHGGGHQERALEISTMLFLVSAYVGALSLLGVALFNGDFVTLWTGPALYGGTLLTVLLCGYEFLRLIKTTIFNTVFALGEVKAVATSSITECILHLTIGVLLLYYTGLCGLVAGAIVSVFSGCLVQARPFMQIVPNLSWRVINASLRIALVVACMAAFGYLLRLWAPPRSWLLFCLEVSVFSSLSLFTTIAAEPSFRKWSSSTLIRGMR